MKRRWAWFKWFWSFSINSFIRSKSKTWVILHGIIPCIRFMIYMERDFRQGNPDLNIKE